MHIVPVVYPLGLCAAVATAFPVAVAIDGAMSGVGWVGLEYQPRFFKGHCLGHEESLPFDCEMLDSCEVKSVKFRHETRPAVQL